MHPSSPVLYQQHPSFQSTVIPANAHSSSKTPLLQDLTTASRALLHPSLPGEADHPCLCDLSCEDTSAPAPMTAGSKSTGRTSVHLSILCSAPASEQKVLQCSWPEGQWPGHRPPPFQGGSLLPHGRPLKRRPGEGIMV